MSGFFGVIPLLHTKTSPGKDKAANTTNSCYIATPSTSDRQQNSGCSKKPDLVDMPARDEELDWVTFKFPFKPDHSVILSLAFGH